MFHIARLVMRTANGLLAMIESVQHGMDHDDGTVWSGSWRHSAGLVAHPRGRGENYLDFYCSGGEGEIAEQVAAAMTALGWHGTPRPVDL
jgi:hypothetical protein